MASDEDYDMSSSSEDLNNSHLTEGELIDSLFITCDFDKVGAVPVSRLIEYLKFTTSAISEGDGDLHHLERLFCIEGEDITIATYRKVMTLWINSIRKKNENELECEDVLDPTTNISTCLSEDISNLSRRGMDTSIVEIDPVDKITDLKYQNRKLTEEITKLRQQIDLQDDVVTINNTEIDKLQKKIKNLQHIADTRQEIVAENEELKSTVSKLQEKKKELNSKITQLDKEKLNFENQCSDLQLKIIELNSQLENVSSQRNSMKRDLAECRHELTHAKELKGIQELDLNERYLEVKSLQEKITELTFEIRDCEKEKDEIKQELIQSQLGSQGPDATGDATEEMIPKMAGSFVCSTPMRQSQSLCMELRGMIGHDKHLPSPLCPKEYHKEYRMDLLPVFDEEDEDYSINESSENLLKAEISNITEKFKHKQSELLAEIDSYFRQEECEDKEEFHSSLQKELTEMTEQMASLAIAKDTVDKRVNHLNESMKKIREENALLRRMQHDSRSMLVECDRDLQNVGDRRLLILKDKLDEEKKMVKNLRKELEEKSRILKSEMVQNEVKIDALKEDISNLKKANMELSEKCAKAEGQINCLQDDMRKSEQDVEIEKHRSFELEENLFSNKLARQMDLKEIWRIVQKDVEVESKDDRLLENDASDTIKQRIFNELLSMKSELYLKGSTIETKNKSKKKETSLHNCSCFGTRSNASSPLVEALTIDFFNGNRSLPQISTENPILSKQGKTISQTDCKSYCTNTDSQGKQNSLGNSQGSEVMELDSQTDNDRHNSADINKNEEPLVSVENTSNSLRRPSYQEAMCGQTQEIPPRYLVDENCNDDLDSRNYQSSEHKFLIDEIMAGDNKNFKQDGTDTYCWNDNMVVFDDDTSYSSFSFSHLSYPFQPLRQDHVGFNSLENEEEVNSSLQKTSVCYQEEDKIDSEIIVPDHCQSSQGQSQDTFNNENESDLSITSSLTNKLEKLTLEDSLEMKPDTEGLSSITEEKEMELPELKSPNPQLSKIRQNNLARRREQMKHVAIMPDLRESRESIVGGEDPTQSEETKPGKQNGENLTQGGETKHVEQNGETPDNSEVLPSIPNTFLKKHGLAYNKKEDVASSIHQLTDSEIENKFTSLSLAFKTDKLTLEKRLEIQERYRDLSEQNVEKEVKGLRAAVEAVSHLPECVDSQVQDVLKRIRRHIDVLQQASTKVSSRAEVYGAVQQEKRMSKAIEIMIAHVENLKMAYEREHSELEEARKLIQDGRPFGNAFDSDSGFASRRSASVCQGMSGLATKTSRRRVSESLSPRGQNGTLSHSISLDFGRYPDVKLGLRKDSTDDEDPKSKFQNAVASTLMKNTVTNTLRTNSLDKKSLSSREPSTDGEKPVSKQNSKEEEAFQKGFEQGYKAQVGRDLSNIREQQNNVSQTLEKIMDEVDQETETEDKNLTETIKDKFWEIVPTWDAASKKLRMTMAGFVFFMALCSIVLSFFPVGQAAMQVQPQYRHMGQPPS